MIRPFHILAVGTLLVLLPGCSVRSRKVQAAKPPAAVQPAVGSPPPPVMEPLSVPQTQVRLPRPQPVDPDALAVASDAQVVELPEPPSPKPVRRVPAAPIAGPKPEAPPAPAAGAVAEAPPPTAEPERPRIQELISPAERKQLTDSLEGRKKEIRFALEQAAARGPSGNEKNIMDRIRSFLKLSDEALSRSDFRQADALAERAQVLARELQGSR